ncbi:MAG: c-type cytochrome [Acidiferrobacterales bacterium]
MRYLSLLITVTLSIGGMNFARAQQANLGAAKKHYELCQSCHGVDGEGNRGEAGPRLAGQHVWYLQRQLENFRAGIRGSHDGDTYGQMMRTMAKMLPNQEAVESVAAYSATLQAPKPARTDPSGAPDKGKAIFASCQPCHGGRGEGNESLGGPRLAGQHDWYLLSQLQNFRAGIRGTHEQDTYGQTMRSMAHALLADEQAMQDVVAYITTLP